MTQIVKECPSCTHLYSFQGEAGKTLRCTCCGFSRPAVPSDVPEHLRPAARTRRREEERLGR